MLETKLFVLLVLVATLLVVLTLRIVSERRMAALPRWLWAWVLVLGATTLALSLFSAAGVLSLSSVPRWVYTALVYRGWVPVGAALAAVLLIGRAPARHRVRSFVQSPWLVPALALSTALSFGTVEVGKLAHTADMQQFFLQSGLPPWANYAVIACELCGAAALLTRRWRTLAAAGLSVLMVGAIAVHARNGDPSSDSLEALHLLILLGSIAILSRATAPADARTLDRASA